MGTPQRGRRMQGCMKKNRDFQPISCYISETIQYKTVVTMECEYETLPKLSNGTIFNDLERPLPLISMSRYYLMLNISETVRETVIVSMEY